jgi:hypothetical protein
LPEIVEDALQARRYLDDQRPVFFQNRPIADMLPADLIEHLVGAQQERFRDPQADRLRGLEVAHGLDDARVGAVYDLTAMIPSISTEI